MNREPLPADAVVYERDNRTLVRFPDDMFVYECNEDGMLARVPWTELPPAPPYPHPGLAGIRKELQAQQKDEDNEATWSG